MNNTTKINILSYASQPDKEYNFFGDIVEYKGKRYFVSLADERVEFVGIVKDKVSDPVQYAKDHPDWVKKVKSFAK